MLKKLSFRGKLLVVSTALMLFVITVTATANFVVTSRGLTDNLLSYSDDYLLEFSRNLDSHVDALKRDIHTRLLAAGLLSGRGFSDFIESSLSEDNIKSIEVTRLGSSLLAADPYVRSVLIQDRFGVEYFHAFGAREESRNIMRSRMNEYESHTTVLRRMNQNSLVLIKPIIDLSSTRLLGLISIEIDQKFFQNPISRTNDRNNWTVLLLDDENRLLSCKSSDIPHVAFLQENYNLTGFTSRSYRYERQDYILNTIRSEKGYFRVLNIISRREIRRQSYALLRAILFTSLAAVALALLMALLFSNGMARTVQVLIEKIKAVSRGEFHDPIEINSSDEFSMIAQEVNHMSHEIDTLINKVYKEQLSREKARKKAMEFEYAALVSKMNPHFLYNTLEGINSMAKLAGHGRISDAACGLADLLRDSLRDARSIVYLEDELDYMEKYLSLKKMMKKEAFLLIYEVDEMLLGARLPRFILQPVIENAFKYGIDKQKGKGELFIGCHLEGENLVLTVRNSCPENSAVEDWHSETVHDSGEVWQGAHLGLSNIDKRLKLLYGETFGISMNHEKTFVTVTITMPYLTQVETNEE